MSPYHDEFDDGYDAGANEGFQQGFLAGTFLILCVVMILGAFLYLAGV